MKRRFIAVIGKKGPPDGTQARALCNPGTTGDGVVSNGVGGTNESY